jgi:ubiquinone/menaquinone biosynthesis C-methylase UbiE
MLNIGVGSGGLEALLVQRGVDVSCLDPSTSAIEAIRDRLSLSHGKARVGTAQALPFEAKSFDCVVMSEVLEHLDDPTITLVLPEVRRVLKPGGAFIGTVPADENLLENRAVCPDCGKVFHRWGHVQSFSDLRLQGLLASEFNDVRIRRTIFDPLGTLNWKGHLGWLVKRFALAIGLKGSGESLYFSARNL